MIEPLTTLTPHAHDPELFTDAAEAVAHLEKLYAEATDFLLDKFNETLESGRAAARFRAFYPELRISVTSHLKADNRLSFGHVALPGTYAATITRPDLFRNYLTQQIRHLIRNHGVPVQVGLSATPMPVHFAVAAHPSVSCVTCSTCPIWRT
jgi:AMP nucleosidase